MNIGTKHAERNVSTPQFSLFPSELTIDEYHSAPNPEGNATGFHHFSRSCQKRQSGKGAAENLAMKWNRWCRAGVRSLCLICKWHDSREGSKMAPSSQLLVTVYQSRYKCDGFQSQMGQIIPWSFQVVRVFTADYNDSPPWLSLMGYIFISVSVHNSDLIPHQMLRVWTFFMGSPTTAWTQ